MYLLPFYDYCKVHRLAIYERGSIVKFNIYYRSMCILLHLKAKIITNEAIKNAQRYGIDRGDEMSIQTRQEIYLEAKTVDRNKAQNFGRKALIYEHQGLFLSATEQWRNAAQYCLTKSRWICLVGIERCQYFYDKSIS